MKCGVDVQMVRGSSLICEAKCFIYHCLLCSSDLSFNLSKFVGLILILVVLMMVCLQFVTITASILLQTDIDI